VNKRPSSGAKNKQSSRKKKSRVWEQINEQAAGVDAGSEHHYVAVPAESTSGPAVRRFLTNTRGLYELADWLAECGVTSVAVEATGVYCVPLLEVLDGRGLEVVLAKPSSLKSVNDRQKSDMMDCQWVQLLHTFGLLRPSHRPSEQVAEYRAYNRHRQTLIGQAATAVEHIKKALTSMNIRIDQAVTDVTGKTGMAIIRAILGGERDPLALAALRDERCAKSQAAIAEDLTGKWAEHHLFELDHAVRTWDSLQKLIAECNQRLEQQGERFAKRASREAIVPARRIEHRRKNVFTFDARGLFFEIFGQDLTQIDGISTGTISVLLAEVGTNVDAWKSDKHFASWLRACPGTNRSGGKNRSGKTAQRRTGCGRPFASPLRRCRARNPHSAPSTAENALTSDPKKRSMPPHTSLHG